VWNTNVVVCYNVSSFSWKTTLKIEGNSGVEVTLALFDFGSLSLLVGINKPLEIVFLEFSYIRMILLFSNLDALIPSVELLIHCHSFFNFIILKENSFSAMELLVKDGKLGLNSKVLKTFLSYQFVDLSQIISLGNVSKSSIASFSNI
jgi:hypothetical protein